MGLKSELYSPTFSDDPELRKNGGRYTVKFAVLQVTVRLPEYNPISIIAVMYGFLPFGLALSVPVLYAVTGRFVYLYAMCLSFVGILLSEAVLKPLLKDPRPPESANRYSDGRLKYGMPSGHSLNVAATMAWSALEIAYRTELQEQWLYAVLICCLPVPWARVWNKDHTLGQVIVGSGFGLCIGVAGYLIRIEYYQNHWFPWQKGAFLVSTSK